MSCYAREGIWLEGERGFREGLIILICFSQPDDGDEMLLFAFIRRLLGNRLLESTIFSTLSDIAAILILYIPSCCSNSSFKGPYPRSGESNFSWEPPWQYDLYEAAVAAAVSVVLLALVVRRR